METPVILALFYLAIGVVCFSLPSFPAPPEEFHWRRQIDVFRENWRNVLIWPLSLWLLLAARSR